MGLETATYISELVSANPGDTEYVKQGDDHLRLLKSTLQNTFPNASKPWYLPDYAGKTTNYTVLSTEQNKFFGFDATSGNLVATLPTLAAGDAGWSCVIQKIDAGTSTIAITPAAGTINGAANVAISVQFAARLVLWNGTTWLCAALDFDTTGSGSGSVNWTAVSMTSASALTAPAIDDLLPIYDTSATANKKIALSDLFLVINSLTEDTSPSSSADFAVTYDASAAAAKKVKLSNLVSVSVPIAATQAELEAASSTAAFTSPGRQQYHPSAAKAWAKVTVSGGTPTLAASHNIASITDIGLGILKLTFSTAFSSVGYAVLVSAERASTSYGNSDVRNVAVRSGGQLTSSITVECFDNAGNARDPDVWHVACFGDQA